jgi:hypothetical protein
MAYICISEISELVLVTYPAHTEASKARKDETSNGLTYEGCFYAGLSLLDQKQVYIS